MATTTDISKRLDQMEPRVAHLERDVASIKAEVHVQFKEVFTRIKRIEAILIGATGSIIVLLLSVLLRMG